ncbi:MAG: ABC transporter permease [Spirulinaceae cyanobacterium SM2_1_0]|nr:ABC transporter permease [Spirulinaceae cyanobacterium SM2_1_0]
MNLFHAAWQYALTHPDDFRAALGGHLRLVTLPLAIGIVLGLPLGFLSSRSRLAATVLINGFNGLRVVPSLAILFIAVPYLGLSFVTAVVALTVLVMPPLLINTDVAFRSIEPAVLEAARGMGMSRSQILRQIELPLALPTIVAGIKTATVEAIASATLAAFVGAGGLGQFIVLGFSLNDRAILLVGALPVAVLAFAAEVGLSQLQRTLQPLRRAIGP